jgi:hypothetical protein
MRPSVPEKLRYARGAVGQSAERVTRLAHPYPLLGSRIDKLLRLALLPFLRTKLARLRCVRIARRIELVRDGRIKALHANW